MNLPQEVLKYEQEDVITTNEDNYYTDKEIDLRCMYDFLYHGIRFQRHLEKLEGIFRERKILAGKYLEDYYPYSDNCNKGEYVSTLSLENSYKLAFEVFIGENISLIISPACDAIETKYLDFETWDKIKDLNLKQLYSYLQGECLSKDCIPIEYVKAIGVPYRRIIRQKGQEEADKLLEDIRNLMEQYNITLPIVEPGLRNKIIVPAQEQIQKIKK